MTDAEAEAVRRSFGRRQIGVLALSAFALGGFVLAVSVSQWTLLLRVAFGVLAAVCVAGSILIWRCPRCGGSFGQDWLVTQCPHCFAELTKGKRSR